MTEHIHQLVKLPDYITLLGLGFGVLAIIVATNNEFVFASLLLIGAAIADVVDGKVARAIKRKGEFGKQLDSLADVVCFGVAPAIVCYLYHPTGLALFAGAMLSMCACLRLARFNISKAQKGYTGMPVTVTGVFIPVYLLLALPAIALPYLLIIMSYLMISSIPMPKL